MGQREISASHDAMMLDGPPIILTGSIDTPLRLGSLFKQVAHRFTSRGHGGVAPFTYNSIMLEAI
jgi:hypothetical protein